ncbi:GAF domain-containing protein [Streptomyces spiroverticillatus]|uniref:GAF domain-containing protein n=1 Tax=Streptomyces finlayi TaxID=67296 RepID=A0A918WUP7_9ACTN|nr:ANTAR domain-containing protein [Streptomyces finlayi]GGZ98332.1 GAF domain-containing protein [Streptomyces spiroverticillatus]GHC83252.1 GAF domain-containing protein [Streptomyces finlayi]
MVAREHGELAELLAALEAGGKGPDAAWTVRCAQILDMDGMCVSTQADSGELLWFSDELSTRLDDLQFTLGEGPSYEAGEHGSMSLTADLRTSSARRWTAFAPGAEELGVRSVFAFPLRLGAISVGALTGYRREPRPLADESVDAALSLCDALTLHLLSTLSPPARSARSARSARPGPYENESTHNRPSGLHRAVVHQASGMLSVELGVNLATALDRLRAYAFSHNRPIVAVSRDVVARRLQLTADCSGPGPCPGPGHSESGNR